MVNVENHNNVTSNLQDNEYCIGWQSSGMQSRDGKELTLLGGTFQAYLLILSYLNLYIYI